MSQIYDYIIRYSHRYAFQEYDEIAITQDAFQIIQPMNIERYTKTKMN